MATKYKLTYFTITGLGEPIRFLLSYMGEDFEDKRIEFNDWPEIKPTTPTGKVPLLEFDGIVVSQSAAISRYLGKKAGIAGDNELEDLLIDAAVDTYRDLIGEIVIWVKENDPTLKDKKKEVLKSETLPYYFELLDNKIKENGGYIANGKLSWGDLFVVAFLDFLVSQLDADLSQYSYVKELNDKILSIPNIKSWVDKRPPSRYRD